MSNNELIISVDGNQTYNKFGLTSSSQQDAMILKINVTTGAVVSSSTWDVQNGMEYSATIEFENDTIYHFGMKEDKYLFVKKHNLTTLDIISQKVYLPTSSNPFVGYKSFHSYGIAGDNLVTIYSSYIDKFWVLLFDKENLNVAKFWHLYYANINSVSVLGWIKPYIKFYVYFDFKNSDQSIDTVTFFDLLYLF